MKKLLFMMLSAIFLSGCDEIAPPKPDQKLRNEIFERCLQKLPAGPTTTMYNDWDEVVNSCERASYYQSLQIK